MTKETAAILSHTLPDAQHAKVEVIHGERGGFSIFSRKQSPLTRLWKAQRITFDQRIAGERLEQLAYTAGIYAPTGMALGERVGGGGERKMSERQLESFQEYFKACKEITRQLGNDAQQTVVQVAVYGCSPRTTGLLAKHKRMAAVQEGLQVAYEFLFPRAENPALHIGR
jgi:hypothetical protein